MAVLAGAWAAPPSSALERTLANRFAAYFQATDQGYSYRYYAQPGPTPVVLARVAYADGRPDVVVRLPERGVAPRLRYQRQLALANHLAVDVEQSRHHGEDDGGDHTGHEHGGVWARSFARHLARTHPGSSSVVLTLQSHLIPDPARVAGMLARGEAIDLDADEFYTAPERIGEFPCDAL